jgi:transposase
MRSIAFIGIDVSKATFDVAVHREAAPPARFPNSSEGVSAFLQTYAAQLPEAFVVLEATGGYEARLLVDLAARNVAVHRADPRAASFFLRSLGTRAKTDRLAALGLARYGAERHTELPRSCLPESSQEGRNALLARRADLVAMRTAEVNREQPPRYRTLPQSGHAVLAVLKEQIAVVEEQIEVLVTASGLLSAKAEVMTSRKGIGKQTASPLLAFRPELGSLTRREAASLAGCAPQPRDSGTLRGYRRTVGGRAAVKRALFMAAMSARNHHAELRQFYERLRQNGKPPMVALTAVMRKLIIILNAKLRDAASASSW